MNSISLVLVIFTAVSGILWFLDLIVFKPKRKNELKEKESKSQIPLTKKEKNLILESSGLFGSIASCFPVLFIVFMVRSFAYEPFRIPSASMMPTLLRGDFILVEKFKYGIRNPFTNSIWIENEKPKKGDVIVFKYPNEPSIDYIKRVVGEPGDRIIVSKGQLYIQEKGSEEIKMITSDIEAEQIYSSFNYNYPSEYGIISDENLLGYHHKIMHDNTVRPSELFYVQDGHDYGEWVVPENSYFAMGDNREHSRDSRYWGFVPDSLIVGRAINIWFSCTLDSGLRINRLGGID